MGLEDNTLDSCVDSITRDKEIWLNFLLKSELGLEEPKSPLLGVILTFTSFIIGSLIPQIPYFLNLGFMSLIISTIISFGSLFVVGALKIKITGERKIKGAFEMLIIGIVAFSISYIIGLTLENLIS
jgi:VIT1/CCC1 family predicted Fe2+/Mn2+ transporter